MQFVTVGRGSNGWGGDANRLFSAVDTDFGDQLIELGIVFFFAPTFVGGFEGFEEGEEFGVGFLEGFGVFADLFEDVRVDNKGAELLKSVGFGGAKTESKEEFFFAHLEAKCAIHQSIGVAFGDLVAQARFDVVEVMFFGDNKGRVFVAFLGASDDAAQKNAVVEPYVAEMLVEKGVDGEFLAVFAVFESHIRKSDATKECFADHLAISQKPHDACGDREADQPSKDFF